MKNTITYLPVGILTGATLLSGAFLASNGSFATSANAVCTEDSTTHQVTCVSGVDGSGTAGGAAATATVQVSAACGFDGATGTDREVTLSPQNGGSAESTAISTRVFCNDASGFSVYTVGYTGNTEGTTTLVGVSTGEEISTNTSGTSSYWAVKYAQGDSYPANVVSGFSDWHVIPSSRTPVVTYSGATDTTNGANFKTYYKVYVSNSQVADTYTGKVLYTLTQS